MPYWRLHYHLVWATRERQPLIVGEHETVLRASLDRTLRDLGLVPHAVGLMPDHVHVALSIASRYSLAEVVRRLKGGSSHALNGMGRGTKDAAFAWQAEYGALSVGERALPDVIRYVEHQSEHHANRTTLGALERITDDERLQPASLNEHRT